MAHATVATVLDGCQRDDRTVAVIRPALAEIFAARGLEVTSFALRDVDITPCAGDFKCWIRSPGVCAIDDANREIARSFVASEIAVLLTPLTFGGYSSDLKKALDHLVGTMTPFFTTVDGETHHPPRYPRRPRLLALATSDGHDMVGEGVFAKLVERNALNMSSPTVATAVFTREDADETIGTHVRAIVTALLEDEGRGRPSVVHVRDVAAAAVPDEEPESWHARTSDGRRALLLLGSPKPHRSASLSLGEYLLEGLAARGFTTSTVHVHTVLRGLAGIDQLVAETSLADLMILASPVYMDSLPAPVIRALEAIAAHRRAPGRRGGQRFAAITNCGFPEAAHTDVPLAICRRFAAEAGFRWAGGLGLGGGGAVEGRRLGQAGGMVRDLRQALDLAAAALADGHAIPHDACDLFARPLMPSGFYRLPANVRFIVQAWKSGVLSRLRARPYGQ